MASEAASPAGRSGAFPARRTAAALSLALLAGLTGWLAIDGDPVRDAGPAAVPVSRPAVSTSVAPEPTAIETISCGRAVLADAHGEFDYALGAVVDPATWGWMHLSAPKRDGSTADVRMLRPLAWMAEHGVSEGVHRGGVACLQPGGC